MSTHLLFLSSSLTGVIHSAAVYGSPGNTKTTAEINIYTMYTIHNTIKAAALFTDSMVLQTALYITNRAVGDTAHTQTCRGVLYIRETSDA